MKNRKRGIEISKFIRTIGLTIFGVCFLSAKIYPLTNKPQTYVSKNGYLNLLVLHQANDSAKIDSVRLMRLKSPWIALGMALVPGAIIHGAGHFYAGKITTGFLLLGTEVAGTGLVFLAGLSGFAEAEGGESSIDPELWGFAGLLLFVGSWVYDVVGSPIAVKKENQKLVGKKYADLKFEFDHKYDSIRIVFVKQF
jgi:hypothetical protein